MPLSTLNSLRHETDTFLQSPFSQNNLQNNLKASNLSFPNIQKYKIQDTSKKLKKCSKWIKIYDKQEQQLHESSADRLYECKPVKTYSELVQFSGKRNIVSAQLSKRLQKRPFSLATPHLDEATYHIGTHITSSTKVWSFKWHGPSWVQVCGSPKHCGQLKGVELSIFC